MCNRDMYRRVGNPTHEANTLVGNPTTNSLDNQQTRCRITNTSVGLDIGKPTRRMTKAEYGKQLKNPFYKKLWNRVYRKNKNLLLIICGGGGEGKSWTAVRIASKLDPSFNTETIRERILMKPKEFSRVIVEGGLKRGNAIIFDEAGTGVNAREWYSFNNKVVNYILQTFRNKNLFVIFTVPAMSYIDKQIRHLFHYFLEARNIVDEKNICKVFELQFNKITGKLYTKRPHLNIDGKVYPIHEIRFRKAAKELLVIYEDMQKKGKLDIQKGVFREIDRIEKRQKKTQSFAFDIIPDELKKLKVLGRMDVAKYFKLDPTRAYQILEKWYAMGYVEKKVEGNKAIYTISEEKKEV